MEAINFYSENEAVLVDDLLSDGYQLKIFNHVTAVNLFAFSIRNKLDARVMFREQRYFLGADNRYIENDRWIFRSGPLKPLVVRVRRGTTDDLFREIHQNSERIWSTIISTGTFVIT